MTRFCCRSNRMNRNLLCQHTLPLSLLQKNHLYPVLHRNRREHGQHRDHSTQPSPLLKNHHHRRDREQKEPRVIKAMIDGHQREDG